METAQNVESTNRGMLFIQGIGMLIIGFLFVTAPQTSTVVLVSFLGFYWLASGIVSLVRSTLSEYRAYWGRNLFLGLLGIAAGLAVLRHPLYSTVLIPTTLVLFLGIDGIAMSFVNFARAFSGEGITAAIIGIFDLIFGVILLTSPLYSATLLPLVLGGFSLLGGAISVIYAATAGPSSHEEMMPEEYKKAA